MEREGGRIEKSVGFGLERPSTVRRSKDAVQL